MADPILAPARVVRQLDGTTWSHVNCAFATAASLALAASGGRVQVTPETMRRRSGRFVANPSVADIKDLGPSNLIDEKVALQHDDTRKEFRAHGLRPPKVRMLHTTRPGIVRSYLAHGATVSIAIGYHVINAKRPASSGSQDFNIVGHDGHAVRLQGLYHLDGTPVGPDEPWDQPNVTDMVDPLADGRRLHGIHVAKGPQRLPLHIVFEACSQVPIDKQGDTLGKGKVLAMVVFPAIPIHEDVVPPGPEPVDPCAAVAKERDDAVARLDALQAILRGLGTAAQAGPGKLAAVVAGAVQSATDDDGSPAPIDDAAVDSGSIGTNANDAADPPDADDVKVEAAATDDQGDDGG